MEKILAIAVLLAYVALLYYIIFGKRKKEKKKLDELNAKIKYGTKIKTISGIIGTVVDTDDKDVTIEVCCAENKSIKARLLRGAIQEIIE